MIRALVERVPGHLCDQEPSFSLWGPAKALYQQAPKARVIGWDGSMGDWVDGWVYGWMDG